MIIKLEGLVSDEIVKIATEGRCFPHAICGVNVYRRPEIATEDEVEIDRSRPCAWADDMFFSGRHYQVIHLLNLDEYDPQSTIPELRARMMQLKAKGAGFIDEDVLEQKDGDTAYVLTPLSDSEWTKLNMSN